jgi:YhcH/YjgK/YiaL family protein
MIVGDIKNLEADRPALAPALQRGLDYLKNNDFSGMELGKYEIDGSKLFVLVEKYQSSPKSEREAEEHHKYIDIQFVASGSEIIGFAPVTPEAVVAENLLDTRDAIYFKSIPAEMDLILTSGMYAIFLPNEIHHPGCRYLSESVVSKIVVKIAFESLTTEMKGK